MDEKAVLKTASDAIEAAQAGSAKADAATAKAEEALKEAKALNEAMVSVVGNQEWQSNLKTFVDAAKGGMMTVEKGKEILREIWRESELDRKEKGLMVGGQRASEATAKVCDISDGAFDYKSFMYATGRLDASAANKKELLGVAMSAQPRNDAHRAYQRAHELLAVANAIGEAQAKNQNRRYEGVRSVAPQLAEVCDYHRANMLAQMQGKAALDPNDTVDTANWMPVGFSPRMKTLLFLELQVAALFNWMPYAGKSGSVDVPINKTNSKAHLVPKIVGGGASVMGSTYALSSPFATTDPIQLGTQILDDKATFNFQMFRGRTMWQGILDDDSPIGYLQLAEDNIYLEIARAIEDCILNGQQAAEIDTGGGGVAALFYDDRNAWDGLRKHVRVQTGSSFGAANAALTATMLMQNGPILGGKYMANPQASAIILPVVSLFHIITDTAVLTAEKFSNLATIFSGALAAIAGRSIILSEYLATNLNASGVYDAITTDRTSALIVHRGSFEGMEHRTINIGVDYWRATDQNDAVGMWRGDFRKTLPSTEKSVIEITNLKTT